MNACGFAPCSIWRRGRRLRLNSIRLLNYRRYRDAAVEFPDGLIGIVGRNGAGKSSLLEAALWALFGHEAARTSKELLKRQDAAPGEDVMVRLEFSADEHQYAVTRRLRGKSMQPEASVEADGQLLVSPGANSWDQANQCVTRLLGFDRPSFESTVVAKQGELAALSELRPAQRKRLLLDMLGIERIESAIQACRTEARLLDARIGEARRGLEAEPRLRQRRVEAEENLAQAGSRLSETEAKLKTVAQRAREEHVRSEQLLEARLRDQELRTRLQSLQARLEAIWTQRTRLAAEAQILREREAEAVRVSEQLHSYAGLDGEIAAYESARRDVDERQRQWKRLQAVEQELTRWRPLLDVTPADGESPKQIEARIGDLEQRLEAQTTSQAWLEAERERTRQELLPLHQQGGAEHPWQGLSPHDDCPVCERPLGDSVQALARRREEHLREQDALRSRLEARLSEVESSLGTVRSSRAALLKELDAARGKAHEAKQRLREAELAERETRRLTAEHAELQSTVAALPSELDPALGRALVQRRQERDRLRDQASRAEEAARRLPRVRDEDRVLQAEEARIVEEREKSSRELQALGYAAGAWERVRAAAEAAQREAETLEREAVQLRERILGWQREVRNLAEQTATLEEARRRVEADLAELKVLETITAARGDVGVLPEFKAHLVGRVRPALARSAASLVRQMTGGRYSELMLDEDYGIHLYDGAVAHPMERFSGGERDVTNLSLRLAVSELVANARGRSRLQFVALDEVFGSQDGERRDAVMRCLGSLSNVFRQVFVVTHLDDVRDRLDHVLRVDEGPDGSTTVECVA